MKVLVIGPSIKKSKGGMSTVISEMKADKNLCDEFNLDFYESYIDGNKMKVLCFSVYSYMRFVLTGKAKKYDIYHIHAASYGSTFRKSCYLKLINKYHKKVIFHIHGAEYMKFFFGLSEKKKKIVVDTLQAADTVIALSDDWKHKFETVFGISNCVAVENGINTEVLKPAITKIEDHPHTFVSLGRLGHRKGTYDLIDAVQIAAQQIPDIKVYLAGDGEVELVKDVVHKKNLKKNIEVVGWADFTKKLELLSISATIVLPSYNEGLPMTILEGMACGKAIISTNVGAIPEVVSDENGILIEPGDIETLSQALIYLCINSEKMRKMSESNIRKIKENFDMKIMHKKIEEIYDRMIKS